jgi:hypothetical protein
MTRDELSDGYVRLMAELYESGAYFDRLDDLYRSAHITIDRAWQDHVRARRWPRWKRNARCLLETFALIARLVARVPERRLRRVYWQRFWAFLRARPEPQVLRIYALKCAIHWHMHKFVEQLTNRTRPLINTY